MWIMLLWGYFSCFDLDASLFAEDDEEEEAAGPYFGRIQVRIQRFGIRVQGSEKIRTLLRLFSCLDLDASFFAEEEA